MRRILTKIRLEFVEVSKMCFSFLPFHFSLLIISFLLLPGCEQTFNPIKDNYRAPFSMFGYLDASADTQTVRITPLQEQVSTHTELPDMHVTLEHLGSGKTTVLKDSLQQFYLPGGYTALNSSTAMAVDFGETYKLTAERPDGASSSVIATIPEDFPEPQVIWNDGIGCYITLRITGVERVADVQYRMRVRITRPGLQFERSLSAPYRNLIQRTAGNEYRILMYLPRARSTAFDELGALPANTDLEILDRHIFIASGGPEWIDYEELKSLDDLVYALPETASNVENGVGYVIGIVSKTIPDVTCAD